MAFPGTIAGPRFPPFSKPSRCLMSNPDIWLAPWHVRQCFSKTVLAATPSEASEWDTFGNTSMQVTRKLQTIVERTFTMTIQAGKFIYFVYRLLRDSTKCDNMRTKSEHKKTMNQNRQTPLIRENCWNMYHTSCNHPVTKSLLNAGLTFTSLTLKA